MTTLQGRIFSVRLHEWRSERILLHAIGQPDKNKTVKTEIQCIKHPQISRVRQRPPRRERSTQQLIKYVARHFVIYGAFIEH